MSAGDVYRAVFELNAPRNRTANYLLNFDPLAVFVARVLDVGGYLMRRIHSLFVCLYSLNIIKNLREIITLNLILCALGSS